MKSAKKIVVAMLCVMFIFSVLNIQEAGAKWKDKCYQFYYNWSCVTDEPNVDFDWKSWNYEYIKLLEGWATGGPYITTQGWYGVWGVWKGAFTLRQWNGCKKLISGNKKMGFFACTDGGAPLSDYSPGCWAMKKVKCTVFDDNFFVAMDSIIDMEIIKE